MHLSKETKFKITKSCGNVFRDIGYPPKKAEEMLAKANLASKINYIIIDKKLNNKDASSIIGIPQNEIKLLSRGLLRKFSIDKLKSFLENLNWYLKTLDDSSIV